MQNALFSWHLYGVAKVDSYTVEIEVGKIRHNTVEQNINSSMLGNIEGGDAQKYLDFLKNGSNPTLTQAEINGIFKVDMFTSMTELTKYKNNIINQKIEAYPFNNMDRYTASTKQKGNYSLGGLVSISEIKESESNIKVGIELNHDLEKLVPIKYHELVNQIIYDYEKISDEEMYEKYNLEEVWFSFEAYTREKTKGVLGFIIVCILVDKGFILQLDWKEDFEEYREHIENYFENEDTKIISFEIDNDQQYYARVPLECDVKSIYEITVNY